MLIHDHSESVDATTARASVAVPPRRDPMAFNAAELGVGGFGFLLLGVLIGWSINEMRIIRLKGQRDRIARRWVRTEERFENAKTVIARMVEEEAKGRRTSAVA